MLPTPLVLRKVHICLKNYTKAYIQLIRENADQIYVYMGKNLLLC